MKKLILPMILASSLTGIVAQGKEQKVLKDPCIYPKRLEIKQTDLLVAMIEDKDIRVEIKACAAERLFDLYAKNPDEVKNAPANTISVLTGVFDKHTSESDASFEPVLRQKVCYAIVTLEEANGGPAAVQKVISVAESDKNREVSYGCINSLANSKKNKKAAGDFFIKLIYRQLAVKDIQEEDIKLMNILATSLGKTGAREGYIPLNKILQSPYPVNVKKAAEVAIEQLDL